MHLKSFKFQLPIFSGNCCNINNHLRSVIHSDVERLNEYFDPEFFAHKTLFQEKSSLDLLEMLAGFLVMHTENYKVVIYPGSMPNAFTYLQRYTNFGTIFINASIKVKNLASPIVINKPD